MLRLRSPSGRRVAALGLAVFATVGVSACREVPGTESSAEVRQAPPEAPAPVRASVEAPLPSTPVVVAPEEAATTPAEPEPAGAVAPSSPTEDPDTTGDPAADAGAGEAPDPAVAPDSAAPADPGEGAVMGTTADSGPPKPLEPWRLVGQPYLVDDVSPKVSPDGLASFTLWFRTKGEFRGVRQGTSVTDDRHFKVGLITLPELGGYVPGGIGMVQRSERMLQKGRYCYTAEVHVQGSRGEKGFPIHRDGAELQVVLDLKSAPIQQRTATVVVRSSISENPPVTPVEKALACR